jgi:ubiquinone/menaquinone biosynthesis C-methylase UbiE
MIKEAINTKKINGIYYVANEKNRIKKFKPWLGDVFSFLYDRIMEKSVFPKKFNGSMNKHYQVLNEELGDYRKKRIIEFAAGSGDAVRFLNADNDYVGIDISAGLLRIAKKKFEQYGWPSFKLFVTDACDTPFRDKSFDVAICNLSLNFFNNLESFISELRRVLAVGAVFFCSVPIPEKKKGSVIIHGNLYTAENLKMAFERQGFDFDPLPYENGALFYFKAKRKP